MPEKCLASLRNRSLHKASPRGKRMLGKMLTEGRRVAKFSRLPLVAAVKPAPVPKPAAPVKSPQPVLRTGTRAHPATVGLRSGMHLWATVAMRK